ncbi:prolipoprotein diacylglyceryl transferase [Vibrio ezurae]|uniref:Phosphatidylglycerol--prolipoprotein diacylglyceryl transferase n=1 Tax=Vibrio ezurae NBRC 102218 TaxID=1219080 RepID=U3CJ33_9VIBR|nr:prolipoprotein diacylglyceryl transferase [Vibrio ezurae]GAD81169.1 prolipoprotein diacylglyceryl transferase [Vibrio ezurae NBRC 102218]
MNQGFLTYPHIDPVLLAIGPISIRWYGLMYLLGFAFAMWLANRRADKPNSGWNREQVSDLLFLGFLGVVVGGRIGYVIFYNFGLFLDNPLYLFEVWTGGMSFHGGLLGVISAMAYYAYRNNRTFFGVADFIAPLIPFGLGVGRIGNFMNDELWGRVTDVPWAVMFPSGGYLPRHPSQLYEAFLEGFVLLLILNFFIRKPRPAGAVSGLFLMGYGTFRFIVEYFREPDAQLGLFGNWISMGQILSTPMILIGGAMIFWAYKYNAKSLNTQPANASEDNK